MATKKEVIIGREPKPEYRKEYDDLLKLSLLELKERYGDYKERAESKLKKVVKIIRPLLEAVPQGLTEKEEANLAEISNEKERAGKRRSMIEKRLKNRQAHNSIGPEETAKLQQVVDMFDNWDFLRIPKNENEDIYKENIAKVMVGLLRNYIDYIPTNPKAEDVEPAIKDAELVSEFFSVFPLDIRSKLQKVRGGLVVLNKKMGVEALEKHELQAKAKEFPLPQRKPTRRETRKLERNRQIFKEQENLEKNLEKRSRLRARTKRLFPMSPPAPLGHRSPLKEGTLRARGKVAVRRRGTIRERKPLASWHPRIRIPSNGNGGPGAPKASLSTPRLQALSPLVEQMRIRAPTHARRGPGAPKASATHSTPRLQGRSPLVEQMRIRAPSHTRRGPGAPKVPAAYNSPTLDPHSPLVEETAKKILNITRKLKKIPENPKQKESALKRFLKTVFFLTRPLFANTPHLERGSVNVPFKGALVPLGPSRRGPGPGAKPPGFNSSGTTGPVIEPNFECPAGFQPGIGGVCVPKPTPKPTAKPRPNPTPKPAPTPPTDKPIPPPLRPKNLPPAEIKILEKGCPNKLPLYEVDLQVTKEHHAKGHLCASGAHFIPEKVLEVGGLSDKAGAHVGNGLHVDDELSTGPQNDTKGVCSSESISGNDIAAAEKAAVKCSVFPKWQGKRTTWRGEPAYKAAKEVVEHPERFDLTESDVAPFKEHFKGQFPAE